MNRSKSRIAVVYDFFPHYRRAVLQELDRNGRYEYTFFGNKEVSRGNIEAVGQDTVKDFRRTASRYIGPFLFQRGILFPRGTFDVVIYLGNSYFITTWFSAAWMRACGAKVLFWTHGWLRNEQGIKRHVRNAYYRLAHGLLLYGERAKSIGINEGFDPETLTVIFNSLDFERQLALRESRTEDDRQRVRSELFKIPERPCLVCSARLTRECRFDLLFDAARILRERAIEVNVLLIGDGPERESLEKIADANAIPVTFVGACYDEERLCELITSCDLTVSPGKVGLTAMQSLAFGVPVITHGDLESQMPEAEAIVPGVNGDYFRKGDSQHLAEKIAEWIRLSDSNQNMAAACIESMRARYTPARQRQLIEEAIARLVEGVER
jgi:glycosyltransferase involved in cell wall biosynthesis